MAGGRPGAHRRRTGVLFLDGFDPGTVGVIHDVGNMLREGWEHLPWSLEILGEYLAHVHVKNAVPRRQPVPDVGATAWDWAWTPMRDGVAPIAELFTALRGVGYDGWVSAEDFSTDVPQPDRVRDNLAYLRELVG